MLSINNVAKKTWANLAVVQGFDHGYAQRVEDDQEAAIFGPVLWRDDFHIGCKAARRRE